MKGEKLLIKELKISDNKAVIIRQPINIDNPICLDDHIPYPQRATKVIQETSVIHYPMALNFTKRIGTVDYEVNTHFSKESKSSLLSQFKDLILSQNSIEDLT